MRALSSDILSNSEDTGGDALAGTSRVGELDGERAGDLRCWVLANDTELRTVDE
jgi:hypothetical protein